MTKDRSIARLPPVALPSADPVVAEMFAAAQARGAPLLNIHLVRAHAPRIAKAQAALVAAIRNESVMPAALRELAMMRTAQLVGSDYVLAQHRPLALAGGASEAQVEALARWRSSDAFSEKERAALAYVEEVVKGGDVADATFAELRRHYTPEEIVELTVVATCYTATSLFTKALRIKLEDAP